jgi:hypothetical protein
MMDIERMPGDLSAIAADLTALLADVGDASASTLGSLYAILGNPGTDDFVAVLGQLLDAALAMDTASDGTQTATTLLRSILERVGETPADPDDSLHTIIGQRDAAALDKNTNDDGTQSHTALLRSAINRLGNVGSSDIYSEAVKIDTLEDLFLERRVVKTVTFDGGAGTGAVGTVALFTVTGGVDIDIEPFCTTNLTEAAPTATIEVGVAGNTDYIIATTNATDIDADEIWHDASPDSPIELTSDASKKVTIYDTNIIATIGVQNVTGGVIEFSVLYKPRTSGASLVGAA